MTEIKLLLRYAYYTCRIQVQYILEAVPESVLGAKYRNIIEESLEKSCYVPLQAAFGSKYMLDGNTDIDGKKFNSGLDLNQRVSRTSHKKTSGNQYK